MKLAQLSGKPSDETHDKVCDPIMNINGQCKNNPVFEFMKIDL